MEAAAFCKQIWAAITTKYNAAEPLWPSISKAYGQRGRHYHNLQHIHNILQFIKMYEAELRQPESVYFAAFYHDIVYKATAKDNEAKSAAMAKKDMLSIGVEKGIIEQTEQLILATAGHQVNADADTNWFIDFDLSILGAAAADYDQYAKAVRREYRIYPDILYKPGRKKVLEHFLAKPFIFNTPAIRLLLENTARENLTREIAAL